MGESVEKTLESMWFLNFRSVFGRGNDGGSGKKTRLAIYKNLFTLRPEVLRSTA